MTKDFGRSCFCSFEHQNWCFTSVLVPFYGKILMIDFVNPGIPSRAAKFSNGFSSVQIWWSEMEMSIMGEP